MFEHFGIDSDNHKIIFRSMYKFKRFNFIIVILFILIKGTLTISALGQQIQDVRFEQVGNNILVYYNIIGAKNNQFFTPSLLYSVDGINYNKAKNATGDVSIKTYGGFGKKIEWNVLLDAQKLVSDRFSVKVVAAVIDEEQSSTGTRPTNYGNKNLNKVYEENIDFNLVREKTLEKTVALSNYISIVTNKENPDDLKLKSIDLAVKLFQSESNIVEASTLNSDVIKSIPVRQYFNKLRVLKYSRVDIKWYDINFISDFKLGPDGKYYAIVTIFQKFEGYNENKLIYSDITQKQIEIIVDKLERKIGDIIIKQWDILLGNISVIETK
jgi:hypothetical protein